MRGMEASLAGYQQHFAGILKCRYSGDWKAAALIASFWILP